MAVGMNDRQHSSGGVWIWVACLCPSYWSCKKAWWTVKAGAWLVLQHTASFADRSSRVVAVYGHQGTESLTTCLWASPARADVGTSDTCYDKQSAEQCSHSFLLILFSKLLFCSRPEFTHQHLTYAQCHPKLCAAGFYENCMQVRLRRCPSVLENSYANGHKPSNITNRWQLLKPLMFPVCQLTQKVSICRGVRCAFCTGVWMLTWQKSSHC